MAITGDMAATSRADARRAGAIPGAGILTSAGAPDNPVYLAPEESTRALYSALADGLQADIDLRLGRPLGTFDRPQPRRAEAWRSGRSLPNLRGLGRGDAGAVSRRCSRRRSARTQARAGRRAFEAALAPPADVAAPIDVEVATPQGRIHVEALQGALKRVQTEVASHVGPAVGVTSGFNAMDGD